MLSKLNCYKFQINSNNQKETKLQKYLRERNEKILEKCFNIKVESNNDNLNQQQEIENKRMPAETSVRESYQQTNLSVSVIANDKKQENPEETPLKIVTKSESTIRVKSKLSTIKKMALTESTPILDYSRKNCPRSAQAFHTSKSLKSIQSPVVPASCKKWKSPFTSFTTKAIHTRSRRGQQQFAEFSYDLSRDELKFAGHFGSPMKPAPSAERQLLNSGQRKEYLMQRYEHSPVVKYNYPEATSWRIGWLVQKH